MVACFVFALLQVFHTVCTIFDEGVTSFVRLFQLLLLLLLKKTDLTCRKRASGQVTKSVETVQQNTEGNVVIDYMSG